MSEPIVDTEYLLNALGWIEERLDQIQAVLDDVVAPMARRPRSHGPCGFCGAEPCFVHCVHCLVDCSLPDPEHGPACPNVTGLWPTEVPDACCCGCGEPLGEFHALKPTDSPDWFETICLACKFAEGEARDDAP